MLIVDKTSLCSGCNAFPFCCALEAREQNVVVADRGTRRRSVPHSLPPFAFCRFRGDSKSSASLSTTPSNHHVFLHRRALHMVSYVAITSATDLTPRDAEAERTTMSLYPLQEHWIVNSIFEGCAKEGRICAFWKREQHPKIDWEGCEGLGARYGC